MGDSPNAGVGTGVDGGDDDDGINDDSAVVDGSSDDSSVFDGSSNDSAIFDVSRGNDSAVFDDSSDDDSAVDGVDNIGATDKVDGRTEILDADEVEN